MKYICVALSQGVAIKKKTVKHQRKRKIYGIVRIGVRARMGENRAIVVLLCREKHRTNIHIPKYKFDHNSQYIYYIKYISIQTTLFPFVWGFWLFCVFSDEVRSDGEEGGWFLEATSTSLAPLITWKQYFLYKDVQFSLVSVLCVCVCFFWL